MLENAIANMRVFLQPIEKAIEEAKKAPVETKSDAAAEAPVAAKVIMSRSGLHAG